MKHALPIMITLALAVATVAGAEGDEQNPRVIPLDVPAPEDSAGGIVVADVNNDAAPDRLVRKTEELFPPGFGGLVDRFRGRVVFRRQVDGVTATIETRKVAERDGNGSL